jgi:succinate dehydrogenase flavin-adding protein (antitoxin of CptAB toxin-antitoxin module)
MNLKKQIIYKLKYRGTKEMEMKLLKYLDTLDNLTEEELINLNKMLDQDDYDIVLP